METIIKDQLLDYLLTKKSYLNTSLRIYTTTNLLEYTNDWIFALGCTNNIDVYIDFSKVRKSIAII